MKIALLVPNSYFIENIDRQLVSTIRLALDQSFNPNIQIEMVGFASNKSEVTSTFQKLLLNNTPDVVIGIFGASLMPTIADLSERYKVPLLAMNAGADVPKVDERNPYLFLNSFGLYQSAWYMGYWAGNNVSKRGAASVGFHEAGYEMNLCFESGLNGANGQMLQIVTTHSESRSDDVSNKVSSILDMDPGFLTVFYSSKEAIDFVDQYYSLERFDNVPLISGYPMFQDDVLSELNLGIAGTPFTSSWIPDLDNKANHYFRKLYEDLDLGVPGIFSVLAWETIHLLKLALEYQSAHGKTLVESLRRVKFDGPRGSIGFFNSGQESAGYGQYLCRVVKNGSELQLKVEKPFLINPKFLEFKTAVETQETRGWVNPYLIA